ncbi:MAG: hypothetical protein R3D88_02660 [Alphaproteobacteria bacterium]
MSGQADIAVEGASWIKKSLTRFFGGAAESAGKTAGTAAVVGSGAYFGLPAAFNLIAEKAADTLGIDKDLALPIVATATAGILGGVLGGGNLGILAMATTMGAFIFKHLTGAQTTPAPVASLETNGPA